MNSEGYLYSIRRAWNLYAVKCGSRLSDQLLKEFGTSLSFQHVGVDSSPRHDGTRTYHQALYAVFETGHQDKEIDSVPLSPTNLESLQHSLETLPQDFPDRDAVIAHVGGEIDRAFAEMEGHQKMLRWLNPRYKLQKLNAA